MPNNQGIPKTDSFRTWSQNLHFDLQTNLDLIFYNLVTCFDFQARQQEEKRIAQRKVEVKFMTKKCKVNFLLSDIIDR